MVTIHPPVQLVGEPKKTKKRKEERKTPKTVANWLFAQTTHVVGSKSNFAWWWAGVPAVCSYTYQVSSESINGLRRCGGSKMAFPITLANGLYNSLYGTSRDNNEF